MIIASCVKELARASVVLDFCQPGEFEALSAVAPAGGLDLRAIQRLTAQQRWGRDAMTEDVEEAGAAGHEQQAAAFRLSLMLLMLAQATSGWSGRSLRRLPLLAHAEAGGEGRMGYAPFLLAMHSAVLACDAEAAKFDPAQPPPGAGQAGAKPGPERA